MVVLRSSDKEVSSWRSGKLARMHSSASLGAKAACVMESWNDPGVGAPMHFHPAPVEEVVIVLAGQAEFTLDGTVVLLDPGDSIVIPPDVPHGFQGVGEEQLHLIGVFSVASVPTIYESDPDLVVEIGGVVAKDSLYGDQTRAARPRDG